MVEKVIIPSDAWPYLVAQRGAIYELKNDPEEWEIAYLNSLKFDFDSFKRFLPERSINALDIGGGMSGISLFLAEYFGKKFGVTIIDGLNDLPIVNRRSQTFSNARVARRFLAENGLNSVRFLPPTVIQDFTDQFNFDLVLSLASWCFHYSPSVYLSWLKNKISKSAVIIIDVRRDREEWRAELANTFTYIGTAFSRTKYDRMVFRG